MNAKLVSSCAVAAIAVALSMGAAAGPNDGPAATPMDATGSTLANYGNILCTAAINSTGTVAGGNAVNRTLTKTGRVALGQYQVSFLYPCTSITAARGWSRIVQVDTLTTGTVSGGVSCTTADRAGDLNGVWVYCTNNTGANVDTSFFLNVLR